MPRNETKTDAAEEGDLWARIGELLRIDPAERAHLSTRDVQGLLREVFSGGRRLGDGGEKAGGTGPRGNEVRLRAVLGSLSANIAVLDSEGRVVAVNPAWERFARTNGGRADRCNVGANYLEVCRSAWGHWSEGAVEVLEGLEAVLAGTRESFSLEYPCPSANEDRWFLMQVTPLQTESGGAVVSHLDISARREAEAALRKERDFNQSIIETTQAVVLVLDREGRVVRFNSFFEAISGWKLEEARGRDWFATFVPARDRERIKKLFQGAIGGTRTRGIANPILRRDGRERVIQWYDAPLPDEEGLPAGLLCTGIDITDRLLLEQEVINAAEEERQRIAHDLHDDLGSLLTGIKLSTEALAASLARVGSEAAEKSKAIAGQIAEAIGKTRGIAWGLRPVGADPEDLMSALRRLSDRVGEASSLQCRLECEEPVLVNDPVIANHLYRLAQEAVHNAVKHCRGTRVVVSLRNREGAVELRVDDDGSGFDRVDSSSGLGLHIMGYRAHAMNGSLQIESKEPSGTRVLCTVPLP